MTLRPPTLDRPSEAEGPSTPEVLFKEARRRRTRRWVLGSAVVALTATGVGFGVGVGGAGPSSQPSSTPAGAVPSGGASSAPRFAAVASCGTSRSQARPEGLVLGCGGSQPRTISDIAWSTWTSLGARGAGTLHVDLCTPNWASSSRRTSSQAIVCCQALRWVAAVHGSNGPGPTTGPRRAIVSRTFCSTSSPAMRRSVGVTAKKGSVTRLRPPTISSRPAPTHAFRRRIDSGAVNPSGPPARSATTSLAAHGRGRPPGCRGRSRPGSGPGQV